MLARPLLLLLAACLLPSTALAVHSDGEAYRVLGSPDARIVRVSHADIQRAMYRAPTWRAFQERHGGSWQARWDEATGAAIRVWGPGWDIDAAALADDVRAWDLAEEILFDSGLPLGVGPDALRRGVIHRADGVTTITWFRAHGGLDVVDARVSLRFKHGRFVMAQLDSMPGVDVGVVPSRTADEAVRDAMAALGDERRSRGEAELVVLPVAFATHVNYILAWKVTLSRGPSTKEVYVDAHDGRFLRSDELTRFLEGTVLVEVDNRSPVYGVTERPLVHAEVEGEQGDGRTDEFGEISLPGGTQQVEFRADSPHFDIQSDTSTVEWEGVLEDGGSVVGTPAGNDTQTRRERAQADAHVFSHEVRAYSLGINPQFPWAFDRVPVRVNLDTWPDGEQVRCNAWFDGNSINFARQSSNCNNTARLADVVYHEYGHGFHGYSIVQGAGGWGDGSLGEGLADYISGTMNDNPELAVGFFTNSNQPLRRMDTNNAWPEDIAPDPHTTGTIIASALWHTREALIEAYGPSEGVRIADDYFWHVAMRASDIEDAYIEVLLADDDNGDLADGTPNQCLIDEQFARHGLGPGVGPLDAQWVLRHSPPAFEVAPFEDLSVAVEVELTNAQCAEGELGEVTLFWTDDPGDDAEFESVSMTAVNDTDFEATLPPLSTGSYVRYFVSVTDDSGAVVGTRPEGSVTDPWYGLWVGSPEAIAYASDFEENDGGLDSELLVGNPDTEGANDWQHGRPGGRAGDPAEAASGELVWGNDISPQDNWNGEYQADISSQLSTGIVDVPDAERVYLQFHRWLTVEDGLYDQADVLVNDEMVWTNLVGESDDDEDHHLDSEWVFRSYDITDLVNENGTAEVVWRITSDGGLQFGGWNIDDVRIIATSAPVGSGDDDDDPLGGNAFIGQGAACACDAADPASAGWLALLFALPAFRRRR